MKLVPAMVTQKLGRNALLLKKSSPTMLFGVGVVAVVGGSILACRATLKMSDLLDESADRIEKAKEFEVLDYSEKNRAHDLALIRTQTTLGIVKLYLPPVIVTGIGIAALTSSHRMLNNRNAALTAAYAAVDEAYKKYRKRVVDKYGETQDLEFRHGVDTVEVGKGDKKKKLNILAPDGPSQYAVMFDEFSPRWTNDPENNVFYLMTQQNFFNDTLRLKGHVFLNEIYDALGTDRTPAGAIVGWIYDEAGPGDNYIDFGLSGDNQPEHVRNFLKGHTKSVILDFNVDGVIYDLIDKRKDSVLLWDPKS